MTRIAILDDMLPAQIAENPDDLQGVDVVWAGTTSAELMDRVDDLDPHVVICAIELLGHDPLSALARLERSNTELVLLLYRFARRADLQRLEGERRRVVQSPLSLARLRAQMMSVVVKQMLTGAPRPRVVVGIGPETESEPRSAGPPRLFTRAQLGRIAEISTSIDCECPHHLSQLVTSLIAFEDYSARCENRGSEDAAMHRLLHDETSRARAVMGAALAKLLAHENITL